MTCWRHQVEFLCQQISKSLLPLLATSWFILSNNECMLSLQGCGSCGRLKLDEWSWSLTSRRRRRERPCMCLCTVYGSHRVHLFKNQKHYLSFSFFLLSSRFLQKLETTKKTTVCFSCALWGRDAWFLFLCKLPPSHPLWARFSEPRLGEAVSWRFTLDLQTWRLCQPVYTHIYEYIENRSCLHIWLWGSKRGSDVSAETRDAPQVRYQVLKLFAGWFLTLFQSHFRLASFNETITIACAVCFCAIVPEKPAFCSTLDLNQREEGEVEPSGRDGWPGQSLRRALGFHQHWEAPPSPTPSSALLSTGLVLEITSSPPPSDFFTIYYCYFKSHGLKGNWSSSKIYFSVVDQSRIWGQKELN